MASKASSRPLDERAVITANRLSDGRVVWLTAEKHWVEDFPAAAVLSGPAIDQGLAEGVDAEKRQEVVAAYEVTLIDGADGLVPAKTRERVRVLGPSARTDAMPDTTPLFPLVPETVSKNIAEQPQS